MATDKLSSMREVNNVENYRVQWTDNMVKLLLAEITAYTESSTSPLNKQVWKTIAAVINIHGYNLTAENYSIKWTGMKKKYKTLKDANNRTGAAKETWEYFNIIDDILRKNPEITPLSIAFSTRGFRVNVNTSKNMNLSTEHEENEENEENLEATNILKNRPIKRRIPKKPTWITELLEQKEKHHRENYNQRKRFLSLLEKYLKK
ncbi:uncharacterized protein LOC114254062 [Monomorium pharaonis]|uniref:uncharacterized protein LOC118648538 n=1 Tax=Monomorium pharaonis TaxID=307658 RepID=UPI00102E1832|nr:uncharacterized protein LOC118648538 [Monomorium pharaonis]XP_036150754.1 uncharacterized protein LOC118648538 [Monomorium pharaonis]XP_036150755.1 uncharacterized protein LOC118648538 [Monomorium pharaonis]XP_036151060.1 uncharacterized protein LOC114254062 [Monomorium pharaonis]XP_036151061.1 uncharacterized protein LOC114254062 [Monomorium pharaonis]XP_036151062.1 uncharacterized protein LOC114254062 [Monomorium pharaonis]XP_036151063.1 uncharacterized protein LOC114254062 [Monomorium p